MNMPEKSPQRIYVAPDGSRIQGGPHQSFGAYVPRSNASGPNGPYAAGAPSNSPAPSPLPSTGIPQINVGLLAWGVILVIFGLLLIFAPVFGAASLQTLLVITFTIAGIAFLALAYVTSKGTRQQKTHPAN